MMRATKQLSTCSVCVRLTVAKDTCFWDVPAQAATGRKAPRVLLLHGADASILEWRFLVPRLSALGVSSVAVDWWSGGWTDRGAILEQLDAKRADAPKPWTLVQQHLHAFWRDQLGGEPVIVVGASLVSPILHVRERTETGSPARGAAAHEPISSLEEGQPPTGLRVATAAQGGAVALDFAASFPEAVAGLVLVDAGGESYKSPPPDVVSAMAPIALGVKRAVSDRATRRLAARGGRPGAAPLILSLVRWCAVQLAFVTANAAPSEELRINSLHRSEPQWAEALGAYLSSGGYARRVGRDLIRSLPQPTLVVWGSEDPILPLEDAYQFERDLPQCVGVREVAGCGHTPRE
jgi:pimeloyl-ACP methyl ester carboxylesterase